MSMRLISICLTRLPRDKIYLDERNGKKYIQLVVSDMRKPDRYGHDISVYVNQTPVERAAKEKKLYVGHGYNYDFDKRNREVETSQTDYSDEDDLPF